MISLKKYQEYKSSNVDFIGDIPKHWEVRKLKFVSQSIQTGSTPASKKGDYFTDGIINWYSPSDFNNDFILDNSIKKVIVKAIKDKEVKLYNKGSILFTGVGTVGKVGLLNENSSCNQQINIITPNSQFLSNYAIYLLFSIGLEVRKFAKATILPIFNQDETKSLSVLVPPLKEQEKIAKFLDTKNKQIEEFVKDKQNQIKLLEEQKETIINKAVTKGLDDSVEFKDSGIEWIGDIPKSWGIRKLKYVMDIIRTGTTPDTVNKDFFNGDINWFKPEDLNHSILNSSKEKVTQLAIDKNKVKYLVKDSILIVAIGATTGKTAYLNIDATFNQQITGFNSTINDNKYYFYTLKNFTKVFLSLASYTTLPILNNEFFKSFIVPLPAVEEQKQIIKYIETETSKINEVINQIQKEIDLIKEYKISLISEVVTGQIKVV